MTSNHSTKMFVDTVKELESDSAQKCSEEHQHNHGQLELFLILCYKGNAHQGLYLVPSCEPGPMFHYVSLTPTSEPVQLQVATQITKRLFREPNASIVISTGNIPSVNLCQGPHEYPIVARYFF